MKTLITLVAAVRRGESACEIDTETQPKGCGYRGNDEKENMILDSNSKKPNIIYPCDWHYKVIGKDVDEMIKAIELITEGMDYEISPSNVSGKGNYFSLNLKVFVTSEVIRDIIFAKLKSNEFVKMVL